MTQKQQIRAAVVQAKKDIGLGGARTAAIDAIQQKFEIGDGRLRALMLGVPGGDYWQ